MRTPLRPGWASTGVSTLIVAAMAVTAAGGGSGPDIAVSTGDGGTVSSGTNPPAVDVEQAVQSLLAEGDAAFEAKKFELALGAYERADRMAPGQAKVLVCVALACAELGRREQGLEALAQAIELEPARLRDAEAIKALRTRLETLPSAAAEPHGRGEPSTEQERRGAAVAITARAARIEIENASKATNPFERAKGFERARDTLLPALTEVDAETREAWVAAALIAIEHADSVWAQLAYDAILRLDPKGATADPLLTILAQLRQLGATEQIGRARVERAKLAELAPMARQGDEAAITTIARALALGDGVPASPAFARQWVLRLPAERQGPVIEELCRDLLRPIDERGETSGPGRDEYRVALAAIHVVAGDERGAEAYATGFDKQSKHPELQKIERINVSRAWGAIGNARLACGDRGAAKEALLKAAAVLGEREDDFERVRVARAQSLAGDEVEALRTLSCVKADVLGSLCDAPAIALVAKAKAGDVDGARAALAGLNRRDADHPGADIRARCAIAEALDSCGRRWEAVDEIDRALAELPSIPEGFCKELAATDVVRTAVRLGKEEDARKAIASEPDNLKMENLRRTFILSLAEMHDFEVCGKAVKESVAERIPDLLAEVARVRARFGDRASARVAAGGAGGLLNLVPSSSNVHHRFARVSLVEAQATLGRYEAAERLVGTLSKDEAVSASREVWEERAFAAASAARVLRGLPPIVLRSPYTEYPWE